MNDGFAKGGYIPQGNKYKGPPKALSQGHVIHHWNASKLLPSQEKLLKAMNQASEKNLKEAFVLPMGGASDTTKPYTVVLGQEGSLGAGSQFKVKYPDDLLIGATVLIEDEDGEKVGSAVIVAPQIIQLTAPIIMFAKKSQTVSGVSFSWKDESCMTLVMAWKPYKIDVADLTWGGGAGAANSQTDIVPKAVVKKTLQDMIDKFSDKMSEPSYQLYLSLQPWGVSQKNVEILVNELKTYAHEHDYSLMACFDVFYKGVIPNPYTDLYYIPEAAPQGYNSWPHLAANAKKVADWSVEDCPNGGYTCSICTDPPKNVQMVKEYDLKTHTFAPGEIKFIDVPYSEVELKAVQFLADEAKQKSVTTVSGTGVKITKLDAYGNPIAETKMVEGENVTIELGLPDEGKVSPDITAFLDFLSDHPKGAWSLKVQNECADLASTFTPEECKEAAKGMQALYALKAFTNYVFNRGETILSKQAKKKVESKPEVKVPLLGFLSTAPEKGKDWNKSVYEKAVESALETLEGGTEQYYKQVKKWMQDKAVAGEMTKSQFSWGKKALFDANDQLFHDDEDDEVLIIEDEIAVFPDDDPHYPPIHPPELGGGTIWQFMVTLPKNPDQWHPTQKAILASHIEGIADAFIVKGMVHSQEKFYVTIINEMDPTHTYYEKMKNQPNSPSLEVVDAVVDTLKDLHSNIVVKTAVSEYKPSAKKKLSPGVGNQKHPFNQPFDAATFNLIEMVKFMPINMPSGQTMQMKLGGHIAKYYDHAEMQGVGNAKKVFTAWAESIMYSDALSDFQKKSGLKSLFYFSGTPHLWLKDHGFPLNNSDFEYWEKHNLPKKTIPYAEAQIIQPPASKFAQPATPVVMQFSDGQVVHPNVSVSMTQNYGGATEVEISFPGTMQQFISNPAEQTWSSDTFFNPAPKPAKQVTISPKEDSIVLKPGEQIILLGEPDEVRKIKVPKGTKYTHIKRSK